MIHEERTMKSDKLYEGKMLNLRIDTVELPDKMYSKREIIEHPGSVAIVPIYNDDSIILVKQYRKAIESFIYELPAGKLEINEEPKKTAYRELREETGYIANDLEYALEFYPTPGYSDELISIFIASNLQYVGEDLDDGEYIESHIVKIDDLLKDIRLGKIKDSKTIIGVFTAIDYLNKKKNKKG